MNTSENNSEKIRPRDTTTAVLRQKTKPLATEQDLGIQDVIHTSITESDIEIVGTLESLSVFDHLDKLSEHYNIDSPIVDGSSSIIATGKDIILKRTVVIKSLRTELTADKSRIKKFIQEARFLAQLDHPSIVPLYGLVKDDAGGLHLAMKRIDGISAKNCFSRLRTKYRNMFVGRTTEKRALMSRLELFLDVCAAIDYAHGRGIVHCDIKPGNIMFSSDGNVFVMDWSSASKIGEARSGAVSGAAFYTSPEESEGKPVSILDDIFSLGMILYEFATLRTGVTGISLREVQEKIKKGDFEPVSHFNEQLRISPVLAAIIEKARNPDPANRYQSVREFAIDIRRFMFEGTASIVHTGMANRFRRWASKHRVLLSSVTLFTIALVSTFVSISITAKYNNERKKEKVARILVFGRNEAISATTKIRATLFGLNARIAALLSETSIIIDSIDKISHPYVTKRLAYYPEEFLTNTTLISTLKYSNDFEDNISLGAASVFVPENVPIETADEVMVKNQSIVQMMFMTLITSSSGVYNDDVAIFESTAGTITNFLSKGSMLRRLTLFERNGVCLRVPGMYEDLTREMIINDDLATKHATDPLGFQWGHPIVNSKGRIVVPFIVAVPGLSDGNEMTFIGEVNYYELAAPIRYFLKQHESSESLFKVFIIDHDANILYAADNRNGEEQSSFSRMDGTDYTIAKCKNAVLLRDIAKAGDGRIFKTSDNGNDALGLRFTIGQAHWSLVFLIEELPLDFTEVETAINDWLVNINEKKTTDKNKLLQTH